MFSNDFLKLWIYFPPCTISNDVLALSCTFEMPVNCNQRFKSLPAMEKEVETMATSSGYVWGFGAKVLKQQEFNSNCCMGFDINDPYLFSGCLDSIIHNTHSIQSVFPYLISVSTTTYTWNLVTYSLCSWCDSNCSSVFNFPHFHSRNQLYLIALEANLKNTNEFFFPPAWPNTIEEKYDY